MVPVAPRRQRAGAWPLAGRSDQVERAASGPSGCGMVYAAAVLPLTFTTLAIAAAGVVLAWVDPAAALTWLAKEGPVEHASHVVLAAAALAWARAGRAGDARLVTLGMTCFLALVLAEEVDWGAVYGWTALGERVAAVFGHRNMHNAARGSSYLLFALPLCAYYLAPGTGRRLGRLAPTTDERAAFAAIGGLFLLGNMSAAWERAAQELLELLLYALLLATGLRLRRAPG